MKRRLYTVSQKNWATFIFTVTLANVGQFLPRDATQSAVLLWQVVCPSVCPSVCLSVRNVEVLWLHRLEIFKNNFMVS